MDFATASRYYEALLAGYLRAAPAGTTEEAVDRFVAPVRAAFVRERAAESVIEGMLWAAWEPVIGAACASDSAQDRLVELLVGIEGRGALTRDQGREESVLWGDSRVFVDLPMFGAQMREAWDSYAAPPGSPEAWVNLNAFAARLTAVGIDFEVYAIWTLRACLEEKSSVGPDELRAVVPWFRHCGELLSRLAHRGGSIGERDTGPARLGRLCTDTGMDSGGFTVERWEFWRGRLAGLAGGTDAAALEARTALRYLTTAA